MSNVFQTQVSEVDVVAQLRRAEQLIESQGTDYPDATYEEGLIDALKWIAGFISAPLTLEEDQ